MHAFRILHKPGQQLLVASSYFVLTHNFFSFSEEFV